MTVTPQLLRTFPLLKPLPEDLLNQMAQESALQKYSRRGIVLKAGESGKHICFLFEGRLQGIDFTIDGREVGLYFLEPGDFCGELGVFDDGPQLEYIIALTPAVVVNIPMETIRQAMLLHPDVLTTFGNKLAARVRQMTQQRTLLGLPNVSQRVCYQIWSLAQDKDSSSGEAVIDNPPTHQEIAIMLNVSRETVTRVFQKLQRHKIVHRDGATRLQIVDSSLLQALAEGREEL